MSQDDEYTQLNIRGEPVEGLPEVRTTDGYLLPWDREKIVKQLTRETELAEYIFDTPPISRELAMEVAREAEKRIRKLEVDQLSGPLIREIVNTILLEHGQENGSSGQLYRNISTRVGTPVYDAFQMDVGGGFESNENANLIGNPETSHKKKADKISKEQYLLTMPTELADAHLRGDLHIHDLEYFASRPFCMDWDLRYFLYYGLMPDGTGRKSSVAGPSQKPEVAVLHAVKALGSAQTNWAGGQGFYNFLTFLAPYLEGLTYQEIEQLMQMFVYEMTQMMVARGGQLVFSSIQLTPGVPEVWRDKPIVKAGQVGPDTYGSYEKQVQQAFKALMNVMIKGDYWGKPFNFPKPEINIKPEFLTPEYDEQWELAYELTSKYGTPYFDNEIPEYRGQDGGISCYQCCAYQFSANEDTDSDYEDKLYFEDGKHFTMGGWQVITLNCPRAAYKANGDDDKLFRELKNQMDTAIEIFKTKKRWMNLMRKNNRLPFAQQQPKDPNTGEKGTQAADLDQLVWTIGVLGINDMVHYHTNNQMHQSKDALALALRTMAEMESYARHLEQKHQMDIALARTPAESTVQRFAVSDLMHHKYKQKAKQVVRGNIQKAKNKLKNSRNVPIYYTNGTHVPVDADISLGKRINIEHKFFPIVDGGNIMHIWLGETQPNTDGLRKFTENIAKNTQTGYFSYTKDMTICNQDFHVESGLKNQCTNCNSQNIDHISRVTGYLQAVSGWNEAKKQELKDRQKYQIKQKPKQQT
ncbi:Oxygen-sensitive ribonucleoside-triphosphate reductase [Methanonatronarchaeum thermophilum]|uniref:Oxygen-sensitive ribonucleoside-triphosphate reductase n=1 Tax=Methanonatronarchaeum thermophilum TaxID=1927129 RepID=A0A1Y3GDE8_9EURY|nr:anaerobic ribonucleoside-triphosphate reductase [Methanonatronarchaeum thermophilum]OUJ19270.1 Oxygen-sensitive ribonucleoside-triphosphate reductase [Methanonatronarchaeum thermophilum]